MFEVVLLQYGTVNGLMQILLVRMSAQITKQLGMAPGGEFRRAFQEVCATYFGLKLTVTVGIVRIFCDQLSRLKGFHTAESSMVIGPYPSPSNEPWAACHSFRRFGLRGI